MSWFVTAVAYTSAPSTAVPMTVEAPSTAAFVAQYHTTPLAGPFATQAQAQNWIAVNSGTFGSGKTNIAPPADTPVTAGIPGPGNPLTPLTDIGDFFHRLTEPSTYIRIGEVAVGALLVYAGVRAMTTYNPVTAGVRKGVKAPTTATKKVAKKAVTLTPAGRAAKAAKLAPKGPRVTVRHSYIHHVKE
jgi:hypothetical protein